MATVTCVSCQKKLKVADALVGKKVKCTCGTVFLAQIEDAAPVAKPADAAPDKVLVACTACSSKLKVAVASLGKKMKCPKCDAVFVAAEASLAGRASDGVSAPSLARPANDKGDKFVGHYRITAKLGAGGMGEVYLAEDTALDRKVALKILPANVAGDADRRHRFIKEAKAASALNHPHVCIIYEVGETPDGYLFLAMEFVEGQAIDSLVRKGPLPIGQAVDIGIQTADALDAAHAKGIVHRDIKPANIILSERGVKVLDFGLAKRIGQEETERTTDVGHTQTGHILGTPTHMSPEQALGKPVDHRTDLFSLGVTLYELVTGRRPFSGGSVGETVHNVVNAQPEAIARFNYEVTPELERIIRKCMQKDAKNRYQSARELLIDLRNLRSELPGGAHDVTAAFEQPATPSDDVSGSDIYISCARLDDQPVGPGKEGWISQFQRNLKVRLEQLSGETVRISNHPMPPGPAPSDETLYQALPGVRTMISVLSPPFAKSGGCRREVEEFWQSAEQSGEFRVEDKARLFKVVKAPMEASDLPPHLQSVLKQLMAFEFFERDPETGRLREFEESFGEAAKQRYHEKVYDLAYEISQVLKHYRNPGTLAKDPGQVAKRVYLAETTADVQPQRDRLKRELLEQGCSVLPDRPLPHIAGQLDEAVRAYLEQCDLAIHLVGERYGLVPEDSDRSVVAQQNFLAAQQSAATGLERLIWMPRQIQARDERQAMFLRELTEDPKAHRGAEIIQDTIENLKEYVQDKWRQEEEAEKAKAAPDPAAASSIPRVYLICDKLDETAVEAVEDHFFAQGVEVSVPEFEQDEATVSRIHWQNLEDCDGVLIYFGAAGKAWVDIKVRDLLKAVGYRKGRPIEVQAVYVAPPFDRRKERFKSLSTETIRQEGEAFDASALAGFVARLKKLKAQPAK
jgi:serine/threonine protein kinase